MNNHINPEQLKEVMRSWITGVAIVTGCHAGTCHGMTANSFNSITLSPPTVLVALRQETRTQELVKAGGIFGVTILDLNQQDLARRFAGQIDTEQPRFTGIETFTMATGAPLIQGGMAYLDCKVVNTFDVGSTTVFIGEVLATHKNDHHTAPLLYLNRAWRKLAEE
jgi:flavin reductase